MLDDKALAMLQKMLWLSEAGYPSATVFGGETHETLTFMPAFERPLDPVNYTPPDKKIPWWRKKPKSGSHADRVPAEGGSADRGGHEDPNPDPDHEVREAGS